MKYQIKNKIRDYKALLTIYGLDKMKTKELIRLKNWLKKIEISISKEQYASIARFRLMK